MILHLNCNIYAKQSIQLKQTDDKSDGKSSVGKPDTHIQLLSINPIHYQDTYQVIMHLYAPFSITNNYLHILASECYVVLVTRGIFVFNH